MKLEHKKAVEIYPQLKTAVVELIAKRAYAETLREKVDAIYTEVLSLPEFAIYKDLDEHCDGSRITERELIYLSKDENTVQKIYAEIDHRYRVTGIKSEEMPQDFCPALLAEREQLDAERKLMLLGNRVTGIYYQEILSLEIRKEYLELLCKLAFSLEKELSRKVYVPKT